LRFAKFFNLLLIKLNNGATLTPPEYYVIGTELTAVYNTSEENHADVDDNESIKSDDSDSSSESEYSEASEGCISTYECDEEDY
jgi:hypothetical protein